MSDMVYVGLIVTGLVLSSLMGFFTWTDEEAAVPEGKRPGFGPPIGLGAAVLGFYRYLVPWLLSGGALAAWLGRVLIGNWSSWDALVALGILAAWPFAEWGIHALEHRLPIKLFGLSIEPVIARTHRAHHENPWDPQYGITTLHNVPIILLAMPSVWLLALPPGPAITGSALLITLFLAYEWVHYLTHTSYRPVSKSYRRLYINHRCHHFRHEKRWYGVTTRIGDRVLRTMQPYNDVTTSDMCERLLRLRRGNSDDDRGDEQPTRSEPTQTVLKVQP